MKLFFGMVMVIIIVIGVMISGCSSTGEEKVNAQSTSSIIYPNDSIVGEWINWPPVIDKNGNVAQRRFIYTSDGSFHNIWITPGTKKIDFYGTWIPKGDNKYELLFERIYIDDKKSVMDPEKKIWIYTPENKSASIQGDTPKIAYQQIPKGV